MTDDIRITGTHVSIRVEYVFVFLLIAAQLWVYFTYAPNPILADANGDWWGWWDQSKYIQSTRALASGNFDSSEHWYPLGYSLLAVPFTWIAPGEPFIFVNAISLALYAIAFIRIFRPHIGRFATLLVLFGTLLIPISVEAGGLGSFPVMRQFVIPWNTIPVAAAYLWIIHLLQTMETRPQTSLAADLCLGMLAAFVLVTRPVDMVPLVLAGAYYLWIRVRKTKPALHIGMATIGAVIIIGFVYLLMLLIHGGISTPYSENSTGIGLGFGNLLERFYAIFISSAATWGEPLSVFTLQPWLFVLAPLAFCWAVLAPRAALLPVSLVFASCLVYLSYNDFAPHNVFRFMLVHYLVWMLPVLSAAGICGGLLLLRQKRWITIGLVAVALPILLSSYRVQPRVVAPAEVVMEQAGSLPVYTLKFSGRRDIDAIDFVGSSPKDWMQLTLTQFDFTVDGQPMKVFADYRTVSIPGGVRVILNRDVDAQTIRLGLTDQVISPPTTTAGIRPVRFDGGFDIRFWRDRTYRIPAPLPAS